MKNSTHFGEILEAIADFEELYTYSSLEEREANGEFDEPSIKQKYDFDLTCRKFIESSRALETLYYITPEIMEELIKNSDDKYKDFLSDYNKAFDNSNKEGTISGFSIISNKVKNNHFEILNNTDLLSIIDDYIIEEKTKTYFLGNDKDKIKDKDCYWNIKARFKDLEPKEGIKTINNTYKYLLNEMDINIKDKDLTTYYNKDDKVYITEINLSSFYNQNDRRIIVSTSEYSNIVDIANNIIKIDEKVLEEASYEEMLDKSSPILPSIYKLYDYMYGEDYFKNEDELKKQIKLDFECEYLSFNNDIETLENYLYYSYGDENYAISALDSFKDVLEGKEANELFGIVKLEDWGEEL